MQYFNYYAAALLLVCLPACTNKVRFPKEKDTGIEQRRTYDVIKERYATPIRLVQKLNSGDPKVDMRDTMQKLRDHMLMAAEGYNNEYNRGWHLTPHKYERYPYFLYRDRLDRDMDRLQKELDCCYWKSEGIAPFMQTLLEQLESLRKFIVTSSEYARERRYLAAGEEIQEEVPQR